MTEKPQPLYRIELIAVAEQLGFYETYELGTLRQKYLEERNRTERRDHLKRYVRIAEGYLREQPPARYHAYRHGIWVMHALLLIEHGEISKAVELLGTIITEIDESASWLAERIHTVLDSILQ